MSVFRLANQIYQNYFCVKSIQFRDEKLNFYILMRNLNNFCLFSGLQLFCKHVLKKNFDFPFGKLTGVKKIITSICCMLAATPSGSDASSDEEAENECEICHKCKADMVSISNLSEELACFIIENSPNVERFKSDSFICKKDFQKFQFLIKGKKIEPKSAKRMEQQEQLKEHYRRIHKDTCGYCQISLILDKPTESDNVAPDNVEVPELKEYKEHRHLSGKNGVVTTQRADFVQFALRCKHRLSNKNPTICCCLCSLCHRLIHRKFKAAKEGRYYTPRVVRQERNKYKCTLPDCEAPAEQNVNVNIDTFFSLFQHHCEEEGVPLCSSHRNEYRNTVFRDDRCIFCTKLLKYVKTNAKITPANSQKQKFSDSVKEKNLQVETPDDFETNKYVMHRTCWKAMQKKVKNVPANPHETPNKLQVACEASEHKRRRLSFGANQVEFEDEHIVEEADDIPPESIEAHDEVECDIVEIEADKIKFNKSEIREIADRETVDFIVEYLSQNNFMTRNMIIDFWNDCNQSLAFKSGIQAYEVSNLRGNFIDTAQILFKALRCYFLNYFATKNNCLGDRIQRRILCKWSVMFEEDVETGLQFTFISNKGGNLSFRYCLHS